MHLQKLILLLWPLLFNWTVKHPKNVTSPISVSSENVVFESALNFIPGTASDSLELGGAYNSMDRPGWTNALDLDMPMDNWFGNKLVLIGNLSNNLDLLRQGDLERLCNIESQIGVTSYDSEAKIGNNLIALGAESAETITMNGLVPEMVFIEGGTFTMGCTPEQESGCRDDENPTHEVTVDSFYLGKYELTQGEWFSLFGENPSNFQNCGDSCPVERVSWYDAIVYCNRLSVQEGFTPCYYSDSTYNNIYGKIGDAWELVNDEGVYWLKSADGYRLPTEAEREFAARGGNLSQGFTYAGSNDLDEVAWYSGNSSSQSWPVGVKAPNELGLYDMSGNVWEWCWDWYSDTYYAESPDCQPMGPATSDKKVLRSGSWFHSENRCRSAFRFDRNSRDRLDFSGFRLSRGAINFNFCITTCSRVTDSLELVRFYNATNGPTWMATWNLNDPVDTWLGIGLNEEGCVESITLASNNLTGTLPDLNLTQLNYLDLGHNSITGTIPDFSNIPNLVYLLLHDNLFTGAIPDFSNIPALKLLFLENNQLEGAIPDFSNLPILETLLLENTQISGPVPNFSNVPNLITVDLENNQLSGSVPNFSNLPNLQLLDLENNNLTGMIPDLGNKPDLWFLDLNNNQLTGSIPNFSGLPKLALLYLYNNQLSGNIPDFSNLDSLTQLYLSDNQLEGCFPESLRAICDLPFNPDYDGFELDREGDTLYFYFNEGYNLTNNPGLPWNGELERWCNEEAQIGAFCDDGNPLTTNDVITADCGCAGEIKDCRIKDSLELVRFYDATNGPNWTTSWTLTDPIDTWQGVTLEGDSCVSELRLNGNNLSGTLIDFDLSSLKILLLSNNDLTGTIPNFSGIPILEEFRASNNQLSGSIPNFSAVPNFRKLYLSGNQIDGVIPDFSNTPSLREFGINNNQLVGSIPDFSAIPALRRLFLNNNQLTGTIPDFSNVPNLLFLEFQNNQLSGPIPNFSNVPNLQSIRLDNNQLSGVLPDFSNIPKVTKLWIHINALNGNIPDFSNLPLLEELLLWNNQLAGSIPDFSNLPNLVELQLDNNQLSNTVPDFSNLSNLQVLRLHNNQLSGTIPNFAGLPNLITLNLYKNQLSGPIPDFNLTALQNLHLYDNQLSGSIPESLGNLSSLQQLYLYNNQLSGCFPASMLNYCDLPYHDGYDTFYLVNGDTIFHFDGTGFSIDKNMALPWQGNLQRYCDGENQIGASCDDGNLLTINDLIAADCECKGVLDNCRYRDSLELVRFHNAMDGFNWNNTWNLTDPIDTWHGVTLEGDSCVMELDLNNNNLSGALIDLDLPALTSLLLHQNQINGTLLNFSGLPSLVWLSLFENELIGVIPDFSNLPNLEKLELHKNQLNGPIPDFSNLPLLIDLWLQDNQINGSLPDFSNLSNLRNLWLHNNQLSGSVPNFSNLPNLGSLYLYYNQFTGSLPNFSNLSILRELLLFKNQITGNIPDFSLPELQKLHLHENQLTGSIPATLGNLNNLEEIYLNDNLLEDCFPSTMQNHCSLTFNPAYDNFYIYRGDSIFYFEEIGYNFTNNPALKPDFGNFELFCQQGEAACCELTITATLNTPACVEGNNGSIAIIPENGVGPFQFNWTKIDAPIDSSSGLGLNISNLTAGNYRITLTDQGNGCEATIDTVLNEGITLDANCTESAAVSTMGGNDGAPPLK